MTSTASDAKLLARDSADSREGDAFGPVALASFAMNPSGAHLFRMQHERLASLMTSILASTEVQITGAGALAARNALTSLTVLMPVHQSLENDLIHRALAGEPRARMMAEQFEREMVPLLSELASLARRYPSPSSIAAAPEGAFVQQAGSLFNKFQERFRREERDLFPVYDRSVLASTAVTA